MLTYSPRCIFPLLNFDIKSFFLFFQLIASAASEPSTAEQVNSGIGSILSEPKFSIEDELEETVSFMRGTRQLRQANSIGHTHIDNIDVKCTDRSMEVTIDFAEAFGGVVYSKGYFNDPKCK